MVPHRSYELFLYTTKPPMKIASMTDANIKKVLSMTRSFRSYRKLRRCVFFALLSQKALDALDLLFVSGLFNLFKRSATGDPFSMAESPALGA
ncbi:MAG: hypothetical protein OJF51_000297 [Nitrospira sp.]|jgi:hypothetical protein|nr:MAG: hypothetical protein OJF51_000297 [Nitrospira sp.]